MEIEPCSSGLPITGTQTTIKIITRMDLFLYLKSNKMLTLTKAQCSQRLFDYILSQFSEKNQACIKKKQLQSELKILVTNMFTRYRLCHRSYEKLVKKFKEWIEQPINIPMESRSQESCLPATPKKNRGRPKKQFQSISTRSKSRVVSSLVAEQETSQLLFASQKSLQLSGKRVASKVIEIAASATPRSLKRMRESGLSSKSSEMSYTPEEALAMMVDCDLTKEAYIKLQHGANLKGHHLYPSYKAVQEAKKKCYPDSTAIKISETGVEIQLQCILDFTLERLFTIHEDVFSRIHESDHLKVICKWGFDGSGGHSVYKQNFSDSRLYGDSNIILCSVVPIEIYGQCSQKNIVYWKASSASSTRFCRPLMFRILKETKENVSNMFSEMQNQITALHPKVMQFGSKSIKFSYVMLPTMFDGKIINILTGNQSTQSCYICKAKAGDMNNIEKILEKACDTSSYKYGLSILHAYIRMMELLLHVCYKMEIQKWQARGEQEKQIVKEKKERISTRFYSEMGLVVDLPKQGGGNSNDGNTARRFFSSLAKVAEITGLDEGLIHNFAVILSTLASGFAIKVEYFRQYCLETAKKYCILYKWYNMSATVHKVLIHGPDIIKSLPLPVGMLSEDIQESRQKDFKSIRLFHSRKTARVNTNTDIFNMLTSDPLINSLRAKPKKKSVPFSREILEFFENPEMSISGQDIFYDSEGDEME